MRRKYHVVQKAMDAADVTLDQFKYARQVGGEVFDALQPEIDAKDAEIERLRALLREVRDLSWGWIPSGEITKHSGDVEEIVLVNKIDAALKGGNDGE